MSQHPSLKSDTKGKAHRSVWKRFERLKFLLGKDKWAEGDSIFGLPKMKLLKRRNTKVWSIESLKKWIDKRNCFMKTCRAPSRLKDRLS